MSANICTENVVKNSIIHHNVIDNWELVLQEGLVIVVKSKRINEQRSTDSEYFCMAPWTHTFISPQSERRLCCASREKSKFVNQYIDAEKADSKALYQPETIDQHWNGDLLKRVRRQMLNGEKVPECEVCNDRVLNLSPYKDWFTKFLFAEKKKIVLENTLADGTTSLRPISFDYRIHNTCNFKCRMCGEQLSSAWEQEKRQFNEWNPNYDFWMIPEVNEKIAAFQKQVVEKELEAAIDRKDIEEIYWVGGEPLVWDFHWSMMQKMIDVGVSKNVYCRYNTNLSRIENKSVHLFRDLLPHFKGYLVCASIDGTGDIGEWIRSGLNWKKFLRNFQEGQLGPGGKQSIALDVTLTLPGLFSIVDMFNTALELEARVITKLVFAFDPSIVLSPLALPRPVLDQFVDDLVEQIAPKVTENTKPILDTLVDLKRRPTFSEQWPDSFEQGFRQGRQRQQQLAQRRSDGVKVPVTLEQIYSNRPEILSWWNQP